MLDDGGFIRNAWYVAGWSAEIGREPLARVMLGEPVVLYRSQDGAVVALADRCPHRNLPLSEGRICRDLIECGYHGLVFGRDGACTHVPGQADVPGWARVKAYPTAEKMGWVFVWMGAPDLAGPAAVPDIQARLADPGWHVIRGTNLVRCGYRLILDNLLDLSHVAYVHASTTGNRALAEEAAIETEVLGETVRVSRSTHGIAAAPAFAAYAGYDGKIDRWQASLFTPPAYVAVSTGTSREGHGPPRERMLEDQGDWGLLIYYALTPETGRSTHQFWGACLPEHWVPADGRAEFEAGMRNIPDEDIAVYVAQQRAIDHDPIARGADVNPGGTLPIDEAVLAMRRILRRRLGEEFRGQYT